MFDATELINNFKIQGISVSEITGHQGGNSQLFKFKVNSKMYVLKVYKGEKNRIENSKKRETKAIEFLKENRFNNIPKLVSEFSPSNGICMEYVKGKAPKQNRSSQSKIFKMLLKLKKMFLRNPNFQPAVDASGETDEIIKQIDSRLIDLRNIPLNLQLRFEYILNGLKNESSIKFSSETMTYSFSDLGVHNIIKSGNKFIFIDYEFFGKDSAIKMLIDYLLHPKNIISINLLNSTLKFGEKKFFINPDIFLQAVPYFSLKWVTILAKRFKEDDIKNSKIKNVKNLEWYLVLSSLSNTREIYKFLSNRDTIIQL